MPRGLLTNETRLKIKVTRLTNGITRRDETIVTLRRTVKTQADEITTLKQQLADKESQRKTLLERLYKPHISTSYFLASWL